MFHKNGCGVVTECNRGIGLSILNNLFKHGADIFECVRNIDDQFIDLKKKLKKKIKTKLKLFY